MSTTRLWRGGGLEPNSVVTETPSGLRELVVHRMPDSTVDYDGRLRVEVSVTGRTWEFGVFVRRGRIVAEQVSDGPVPEYVERVVRDAGVQEVEA